MNLPAAGVVKPIVELLMVTLSIVPPVITIVLAVTEMTFGFISHNSQACVGLPVVGSRNAEYGMLMLLFGRVVAISYPLRLPSILPKQSQPSRGR